MLSRIFGRASLLFALEVKAEVNRFFHRGVNPWFKQASFKTETAKPGSLTGAENDIRKQQYGGWRNL
jgi:hypothetical protein